MLNYEDLTEEEINQLIEAMIREAREEKIKQTIGERPYLQVPPPMPGPFDRPEETDSEPRGVIIIDM